MFLAVLSPHTRMQIAQWAHALLSVCLSVRLGQVALLNECVYCGEREILHVIAKTMHLNLNGSFPY